MDLLRELPKRTLHDRIGCVLGDAEDLVRVAIGLKVQPSITYNLAEQLFGSRWTHRYAS